MKTPFDKILPRSVLLGPIGLVFTAGLASASVTLPTLEAGWWQTTSTTHTVGQPASADAPPDITYNCENAASWAAGMKTLTTAIAGCTMDIEGADGNYTSKINCTNIEGTPGTMTTTGSLIFTGQTGLHMVTDTSSNIPSIQMNETDHTVEDSKYLGACPAGVMPGDAGDMENGVFHKTSNALSN